MEIDRRTSFRCAVQTYPDAGMLRSEQGETIIRIVEMSSGGFGIVADRMPHASVGDTAELITNISRWQVNIRHINAVGDQYSIGLERIRELERKSNSEDGEDGLETKNKGMSKWILISVGIVSAALTWIALLFVGGSSEIPTPVTIPERWQVPDDREGREARLVRSLQLLDELKTRKMIEQLRLSGSQRLELKAIVDKTMRDMNAVHATMDEESPDGWSQLGMMVVHRTWKEVNGILNDAQSNAWDNYVTAELVKAAPKKIPVLKSP